jgi:hypothetical protein
MSEVSCKFKVWAEFNFLCELEHRMQDKFNTGRDS